MIENSTAINHQLGSKQSKSFPVYLIVLSFACCFIIGFWPFLDKLLWRWSLGDTNYCYLVVPIFLYLCWEKREIFKFNQLSWSLWGIVGYALAIFLIVVGELGSVETFVYLGLWFVLLASTICLYGKRSWILRFEFMVLLFIVPLPNYIIKTLTFNLKLLASTFSVKMLRLTGISVHQDGNIIDLGIQQLQVVDACSGLRYVLPLFLLALLVGYFYSRGRIRQILLLLFVLPVAIVVNGFRIFITGVLSVNGYQELADSFFHDFAGLVLFVFAAGILLLIALLSNRFGPKFVARENEKDPGGHCTKKVSASFFIIFYCSLLLGSGWVLQRLPATLLFPERADFSSFPSEIDGWQGDREYITDEILAELWSDDYVKVTFRRQDRPGQQIYLLIPYYKYQGANHTAHAPQSCLLGGGWILSDKKDRDVSVGDKENIRIRTMLMRKGENNLVAEYFFLGRGRVITNPWVNKFYLLWDAFTKRRTDGALVRIEMVVTANQSSESIYSDLDNFITQLWKILPHYIPG